MEGLTETDSPLILPLFIFVSPYQNRNNQKQKQSQWENRPKTSATPTTAWQRNRDGVPEVHSSFCSLTKVRRVCGLRFATASSFFVWRMEILK